MFSFLRESKRRVAFEMAAYDHFRSKGLDLNVVGDWRLGQLTSEVIKEMKAAGESERSDYVIRLEKKLIDLGYF